MNKPQEYRELIIELAKLFKPKVYVELGARFGYTFNSVREHCGIAHACDLRLKGIKQHANVRCHEMNTDELAKKWKGPIDMLFIDADHSAEAVLNDFNNFAPHVKKHTGLIVMHDTYPVEKDLLDNDKCADAWKVAKELHISNNDYEIVTLPGPWAGLSIARKVKDTHGWMDEKIPLAISACPTANLKKVIAKDADPEVKKRSPKKKKVKRTPSKMGKKT